MKAPKNPTFNPPSFNEPSRNHAPQTRSSFDHDLSKAHASRKPPSHQLQTPSQSDSTRALNVNSTQLLPPNETYASDSLRSKTPSQRNVEWLPQALEQISPPTDDSSLERPKRNNCSLHDAEKAVQAKLRRISHLNPDSRTAQVARRSLQCACDAILLQHKDESIAAVPLVCRKKFCPVCMRAWSQAMTTKLMKRVEQVPFAHLRHVTLTIPNSRRGQLRSGCETLIEAFRRWKNQGRKARPSWWDPIKGYYAKIEITYKWDKFWHPHIHLMLHCPQGFDLTKYSPARNAWKTITRNLGSPAVCINISRPQKKFATVKEFSKYTTKFCEVADLNTREFHELIAATDHMRWHQSAGTLRISIAQQSRGLERLGKLIEIAWTAIDPATDIAQAKRCLALVRRWAEIHPRSSPTWNKIPEWIWQI